MRIMRVRNISFPENVAYVPYGQMDDPCSVTKYEKTTSYLNLFLPCRDVGGITCPRVSGENEFWMNYLEVNILLFLMSLV